MPHTDTAAPEPAPPRVNHSTSIDQPSTEPAPQSECPTKCSVEIETAFETPIRNGNVVNANVKTTIGCEVDVKRLVEDHDWADLGNGGGFCQLDLSDDASVTLYRTGTVVITGATTADDIITAVERVHGVLRDTGLDTTWDDLDVTNIVVEFQSFAENDVESPVNLNSASIALGRDSEYEPAQFSGLVYRPSAGKTCLLFSTGATIVQGAQSTTEAADRKDELLDRLDQYDLLD